MPEPTSEFPESTSMSFGLTSTSKLGWECCTMPPCCGTGIYISDLAKTWGEDANVRKVACCGGNKNYAIENVRVQPNGKAYTYEFTQPCCDDRYIAVSNGSTEVGRLTHHTYCCPCGKVAAEATDALGKSRYSLHYATCGDIMCPCCKKTKTVKPGCCDKWMDTDTLYISGPAENPKEEVAATVSMRYNRCCPGCYPWWQGFKEVPNADEDDKALLMTFLIMNLNQRMK